MNKAEELIACLEGEIAKRDEELAACRVAVENCELFRVRIAELEADRDSHQRCAIQAIAKLAAIKAQEPVYFVYTDRWGTHYTDDKNEFDNGAGIESWTELYSSPVPLDNAQRPVAIVSDESFSGQPVAVSDIITCELPIGTKLYAAPVSEAKAQGVVMPDVNAAAKALCNRHAMICGVDADDQWKEYSQDFIADAETVLANARLTAAPVQQVSVPDGNVCVPIEVLRLYEFMASSFTPFTSQHEQIAISLRKAKAAMLAAAPSAPEADAGLVASEWTKDAEEWGGALNYAAWEFINECPEKSALLFNNTKGPLRAAIMKYAELVAAHRAATAPGDSQ